MTAAFTAITAVVLTEPPGTSAVRSAMDASAISRITSIILSKADPTLLEQGLGVVRALGGKKSTLTSEEVRSIAPVVANLMGCVVLGHSHRARHNV
jgi:hypothetical protein